MLNSTITHIKNTVRNTVKILFGIAPIICLLFCCNWNGFATNYTGTWTSVTPSSTTLGAVANYTLITTNPNPAGSGTCCSYVAVGKAVVITFPTGFTLSTISGGTLNGTAIGTINTTATTVSFNNPVIIAKGATITIILNNITNNSTASCYQLSMTIDNATGTGAGNQNLFPSGTNSRFALGSAWCYCPSTYTNTTDDYIKQVKINTILNNSGQDGANSYGDYTSQSTNLTRGATYKLEYSVYIAAAYRQYFMVYFDWNNNGVLNDAGEAYDIGVVLGSAGGGTWGGSFDVAVPVTATLGQTRMRIIEQFTAASPLVAPGPCDAHPQIYGETEDYSIVVTDNMIYSSGLVTQTNTSGVNASAISQEIIGIKIITIGPANPLSTTSFSFNTLGTDNPLTNISNAKLISTGASGSFATTPQVGSTVAVPNGNFSFTFTQALLTGDNYFWLTYDVNGGAITGEFIDAKVNNIVLSSGTYIPSSNNPSGNRPIGPMTYVSSTVKQITPVVGVNTTNNQILRIEVVTKGALSPLSATSFSVNANGTSTVITNKVQNGKIFYTGTDSVFNSGTQFGSTVVAIDASTVAIAGSSTLSIGTNYFWLSLDVKSSALTGDAIDGECSSITVGGTPRTPTVSVPSGNRIVGVAWTGTTSTNWRVATNWSSGSLPTSATDVIIPPVAIQPTIDGPLYSTNQNGDCRDIFVMPGATLTIKAMSSSPSPMAGNEKGKLVVSRNFTNDGTVKIIHYTLGAPAPGDYILPIYLIGTGTIGGYGSMPPEVGFEGFFNGYFLVDDNAVYSLANNFPKSGEILSEIRVGGSGTGATFSMGIYSLRTLGIKVMSGNTFNQNSGKLMFEGSPSVGPNTSVNSPYGAYTGGTINWGQTVYFTDEVAPSSYFPQRCISASSTPYLDIVVQAEAITDGSTGTIICDNLTYENSGSTEKALLLWSTSTLTVNQNLTIGENCRIQPSVSTNQILNVKGNLINNGVFQGRSDDEVRKITTTFNGSSQQTISGVGTTTFSNLTLFNTSSTGVILNKPVTVKDIFTLTDGNLYSDATNLITMNEGSSVSGGSVNSFVDGPIKKIGNTAFTFPTGNGTRWARLGITAPTTATTEYTAQYFANDPTADGYSSTSLAAGPPTLNNVSENEYWTLDQAVNNDDVQVTLYWENNYFSRIYDCDGAPDDLRLAHWNGSAWEINVDGVVLTGTCSGGTSGTMQSNAVQPSYSPMTFGSKTGINPLPVELSRFNAFPEKSDVKVIWTTFAEINNNYFSIERCNNNCFDNEFKNWEVIATVDGAGNSNRQIDYSTFDKNPFPGISYYRLKQTDYDGQSKYFNPVAVNFDTEKQYSANIYPNPTKGAFTLILSGYEKNENISISLINSLGTTVYSSGIITGNKGEFNVMLKPAEIPCGVYLLEITSAKSVLNRKIIVK